MNKAKIRCGEVSWWSSALKLRGLFLEGRRLALVSLDRICVDLVGAELQASAEVTGFSRGALLPRGVEY